MPSFHVSRAFILLERTFRGVEIKRRRHFWRTVSKCYALEEMPLQHEVSEPHVMNWISCWASHLPSHQSVNAFASFYFSSLTTEDFSHIASHSSFNGSLAQVKISNELQRNCVFSCYHTHELSDAATPTWNHFCINQWLIN